LSISGPACRSRVNRTPHFRLLPKPAGLRVCLLVCFRRPARQSVSPVRLYPHFFRSALVTGSISDREIPQEQAESEPVISRFSKKYPLLYPLPANLSDGFSIIRNYEELAAALSQSASSAHAHTHPLKKKTVGQQQNCFASPLSSSSQLAATSGRYFRMISVQQSRIKI